MAGHGVPQAVIDAAFEASREFHALPLADKMRLKLNENNIGYLPVNQSMAARLDRPQGHQAQLQRELLHQPRPQRRSSACRGRETRCAGATSGPRAASGCAPRHAALLEDPGGRRRADAAGAGPVTTCRPATSRPASRTRRTSTCVSCMIGPQDTDDDEQFGQGPHTDNSFITMLARERMSGLAVRLPSGERLAAR